MHTLSANLTGLVFYLLWRLRLNSTGYFVSLPENFSKLQIVCLFVNLDLGQHEYKTMRTLLGIEPTAISHTHAWSIMGRQTQAHIKLKSSHLFKIMSFFGGSI